MSTDLNINFTFEPDDKGYFDRECPNENCLHQFKINMSDWNEKLSDGEIHCPICGHIDTSEKWWTQSQLDYMYDKAMNVGHNYIVNEINKSLKNLERSTKRNKNAKVKYKPGKNISVDNNPWRLNEEWEQDIECSICKTRYSVIGMAYFCPFCGNIDVDGIFDRNLQTIDKIIFSLPEMEKKLMEYLDKDAVMNMIVKMLESSLSNVISVFQKFAESKFKNMSDKNIRPNDFQIVEKGSALFSEFIDEGYLAWVSEEEVEFMNLMFQRRHILEHNGGIIDEAYLNKTNDPNYNVGQRYVIKKADIYNLTSIIDKIGSGIKKLS